ncbi:DUF6506 family protein [Spiroplasma endosymbiont of Virgichneumon dumeticola]|uniref:DUF6506 family protein n=1 Tax=Spiroplasma endosymbiont of Virgichneumon dumeticola TaxID=3139323 RepID=UPI0035C916BC
MALISWAFIYLNPGFNEQNNSFKTKVGPCQFQVIALDVNEKALAIDIAKRLLSEGVQTIELCGGFGPQWVTKISEAIEYKIPVGGVMYGPEFRKSLYELMNFKK